MKRRLSWAMAGVLLLLTLTGCDSPEHQTPFTVAQAAAGFMETQTVDGLKMTLVVEPLVAAGENRFVVTLNQPAAEVEAQLIMAGMGHGGVVDLAQKDPTRFEAASDAMNMGGKWIVRVKVTLPSGEEKSSLFYLTVKE